MHLQLVVDAGLDPLEDHPIGMLDLAIGFGVVYRCPVHLDALGVIEV